MLGYIETIKAGYTPMSAEINTADTSMANIMFSTSRFSIHQLHIFAYSSVAEYTVVSGYVRVLFKKEN